MDNMNKEDDYSNTNLFQCSYSIGIRILFQDRHKKCVKCFLVLQELLSLAVCGDEDDAESHFAYLTVCKPCHLMKIHTSQCLSVSNNTNKWFLKFSFLFFSFFFFLLCEHQKNKL